MLLHCMLHLEAICSKESISVSPLSFDWGLAKRDSVAFWRCLMFCLAILLVEWMQLDIDRSESQVSLCVCVIVYTNKLLTLTHVAMMIVVCTQPLIVIIVNIVDIAQL